MPYTVQEKNGEYCVYKEDEQGSPTGGSLGCHSTMKEAEAQVAALYAKHEEEEEAMEKSVGDTPSGEKAPEPATEPVLAEESPQEETVESKGATYQYSPLAIKAFEANDDVYLHSYAILWGDENRKDLHQEFFTKNTSELTTIFDTIGTIPYLSEHGGEEMVTAQPVAKVVEMGEDEVGLWWKAKVIQHERYRQFVQPFIEQDMLFTSSGTLPAAKRVRHNGEITRWPIVEITGTTTPAEYRMLSVPIDEVEGHYKSIGVEFKYERTDKKTADPDDAEKVRRELELRQRQLYLQLEQIS